MNSRRSYGLLTTNGVSEESVAAVNDDVARVKALREFGDDRVGTGAGLHHDDGRSRCGERGDKVIDALGGHEPRLGVFGHEGIRAGKRSVVDGNSVALTAGQIARQI